MLTLPSGLLALPGPGDVTIARLDRKLALLAARTLLSGPLVGLDSATARALLALRPWLERRLAARGVLDILRVPEVLTPVLAWTAGAAAAEDSVRAAIPSLLLRLAEAGLGGEQVLWDRPFATLLVGDRRCAVPAEGISVHGGRHELRVAGRFLTAEVLPGERVLFPLEGGVNLAITDPNPLAMVEDHPDKAGNAIDLGGYDVEAWVAALREALGLVALGLPEWHAELLRAAPRLVPVGFHAERHLSASYREAPAQAYLSLHPDPLTLAEAIVHEAQHGKLNRLSWFDAVLENGRSTWTSSPVRPDMRPLMGVLLAAHAFIPVAALHARLAALNHPLTGSARFQERRAEVLRTNAASLDVVCSLGQPTPGGRAVIAALQDLHAATRAAAGGVPAPLPDPR